MGACALARRRRHRITVQVPPNRSWTPAGCPARSTSSGRSHQSRVAQTRSARGGSPTELDRRSKNCSGCSQPGPLWPGVRLALGTDVRPAAGDRDALDRSPADPAGLPVALKHPRSGEERAALAEVVDVVDEAGSAMVDGGAQDRPDRLVQAGHLRRGQTAGESPRVQAGHVQGLIGVYVANAGQCRLVQDEGSGGSAACLADEAFSESKPAAIPRHRPCRKAGRTARRTARVARIWATGTISA